PLPAWTEAPGRLRPPHAGGASASGAGQPRTGRQNRRTGHDESAHAGDHGPEGPRVTPSIRGQGAVRPATVTRMRYTAREAPGPCKPEIRIQEHPPPPCAGARHRAWPAPPRG